MRTWHDNNIKLKIVSYKGLSKKDIEEDTEEKGLYYLLRWISKGKLFRLLKNLSEDELDVVLR